MRYRETVRGNGGIKDFRLGVWPIETSPAIRVYLNNVLKTLTTDYTVDLDEGIVTFVTAPAANDEVRFDYSATVFTDDEVNYFLGQGSNSTTLGAVYMLLAWSADKAKIAKRQTLAGGGGMGTEVVDTSVASKELRETAKAYYTQWEKDEGASVPFEMITEIAWTSWQAERMVRNEILRELL